MRNRTFVGIALTLALAFSACGSAGKKCCPKQTCAKACASEQVLRHVVIFKYKETATPAQIDEITTAFAALQEKIPGIKSFEWGVNSSPEGIDQGFTHCYLLTFENAAARDAYLPHPEHKKFGKLLGESGIFAGAFVVDYNPQK